MFDMATGVSFKFAPKQLKKYISTDLSLTLHTTAQIQAFGISFALNVRGKRMTFEPNPHKILCNEI